MKEVVSSFIQMSSPTLSTGHAQSMESGQTRQFYEEIHFLLDSMKPCRPAHTRCLRYVGVCVHAKNKQYPQKEQIYSLMRRTYPCVKVGIQLPLHRIF